MDAAHILQKLRKGSALCEAEIYWFANGLADGAVTDAQAGAFAMGVCTRGLGTEGRVHLTAAMVQSGETLRWSLPGPVLDKHSTGGVGDPVSLALAPALAACGAYVPMVSGRGLGHTGGTLDKLEAIPGLTTRLSVERLQAQVDEIGCAIVAANDRLAPADARLYGVRDVTGTVDSIDLICASILSKKLAEGLEALVLDVKTGSGAIMADPEAARGLARALVETAQGAGCMTTALITDMSQPAVPAAGNALEVVEVMKLLTGGTGAAPRLRLLVETLGGEALALGGMAADAADGAARIRRVLDNGAAVEIFGKLVSAQGGPTDFPEHWRDRLPAAPVVVELRADMPGVISAIDTRALGEVVLDLGGGRRVESDRVNPAVGLSGLLSIGDNITSDQPLARIHALDTDSAEAAAAKIYDALSFSQNPVTPPALIGERIG
jgi:thymidine phosphorylase